jgi:hypothetical protein
LVAARAVGREISTEISHRNDIEGEKSAVPVERQAPAGMIVTALCGAHELLAALGDAFDGQAQPPRRPRHQHPFGVKEVLDAEPAPDIGCAHCDAVERHIEDNFSELLAQAMDALAGQQQVEAVGSGIVSADRGTRLDRGDHQAVVDQLDLDGMGCRRKRRIDCRFVAAPEPVR